MIRQPCVAKAWGVQHQEGLEGLEGGNESVVDDGIHDEMVSERGDDSESDCEIIDDDECDFEEDAEDTILEEIPPPRFMKSYSTKQQIPSPTIGENMLDEEGYD